jgi:hypothetical protein
MKSNLFALTLITLAAGSVYAFDMMGSDGGREGYVKYSPNTTASKEVENEKDMKISYLNKLLEQQQKMYEDKIVYLEDELKKSKERLIDKSINQEKMQAYMQARFNEESSYFKRELVAKTKTLMEYQRQLEKIKPSEDMKELIKVNTQMALELRRSADQLAMAQIQLNNVAKVETAGGRKPASVGK